MFLCIICGPFEAAVIVAIGLKDYCISMEVKCQICFIKRSVLEKRKIASSGRIILGWESPSYYTHTNVLNRNVTLFMHCKSWNKKYTHI